jgi:hypothetical protein
VTWVGLEQRGDECVRTAVATVLQVNVDDLPETDFTDPDWVGTFRRQLHESLGVRLEPIPRDRLPARGMWIAIVDGSDKYDAAVLHAVVCRDQFVVHDPARRVGLHPVTDYRIFSGWRVLEP